MARFDEEYTTRVFERDGEAAAADVARRYGLSVQDRDSFLAEAWS